MITDCFFPLFFRTHWEAVLMPLSHLWVRCQSCTCGHMSCQLVTSTAWPLAAATSGEMSLLGPRQRWSFVEVSRNTPLTPVTERLHANGKPGDNILRTLSHIKDAGITQKSLWLSVIVQDDQSVAPTEHKCLSLNSVSDSLKKEK